MAKTVTITAHANGDIDVQPALTHVAPGDGVKWKVKLDGGRVTRFVLPFDSAAAFGKPVIQDDGSGGESEEEMALVCGTYHYQVVVVGALEAGRGRGKGGRGPIIVSDPYCPTIIIR